MEREPKKEEDEKDHINDCHLHRKNNKINKKIMKKNDKEKIQSYHLYKDKEKN